MSDLEQSRVFLRQLQRWGGRNGHRSWAKIAAAIGVDRATLWRWRKSGIPDSTIAGLKTRFPAVIKASLPSRVRRTQDAGAYWPLFELWADLRQRGVLALLEADLKQQTLSFPRKGEMIQLQLQGGENYVVLARPLTGPVRVLAAGQLGSGFRTRAFRYVRLLLS